MHILSIFSFQFVIKKMFFLKIYLHVIYTFFLILGFVLHAHIWFKFLFVHVLKVLNLLSKLQILGLNDLPVFLQVLWTRRSGLWNRFPLGPSVGDLHRVGDGAGQAGQRHGRLRPHPLHSHPAVLAAFPEVSFWPPWFSPFRLGLGDYLIVCDIPATLYIASKSLAYAT